MNNEVQTEVREITIDELKKVTWDCAENTIVGCHQDNVFRIYLFDVVNSGSIHPLTIQRCNVEEGWVEHLVCESYPDIEDVAGFFNEVEIKRDKNGDTLKKKVYQDVSVNLLDAQGNVILTLSKE